MPDTASYFKKILEERGITCTWAARQSGIQFKRLWRILNGKSKMIVEEFIKLCKLLEIDMNTFK